MKRDLGLAILDNKIRSMKLKKDIIITSNLVDRNEIFPYERRMKKLFMKKLSTRKRMCGNTTVIDGQTYVIPYSNSISPRIPICGSGEVGQLICEMVSSTNVEILVFVI